MTVGDLRPGAAGRGTLLWLRTGPTSPMPRRPAAETAAIRFDIVDGPSRSAAIAASAAAIGGRVRTLATVRPLAGDPPLVEIELEVEGVTEDALVAALEALEDVRAIHRTQALGIGVRQAHHRRRRRCPGRPGRARAR